ncbi:Sodium- and chloride-dependent GABA transporter 1 [Cichlidogyrus casuarinus]|uniref:Sodium- and chloride-dependent GABA transporter 1 n=1 Tax=Cichlidogyrus casuarinus TaxID=1844966 RepID=A0ABD2PZY2_9PLAT
MYYPTYHCCTLYPPTGPGLVFIVYPTALSVMPYSAIWSVLFFFMLFLVGIDSQFCTLEGMITAIIDEWPHLFRHRRQWLILALFAVSFFIGLASVTQVS